MKLQFGMFRVAQLLRKPSMWVEDCIHAGWDLGPGIRGEMEKYTPGSARKTVRSTSKIQKSRTTKKQDVPNIVAPLSTRAVATSSLLSRPGPPSSKILTIPITDDHPFSGTRTGTKTAQLKELRQQIAKLTQERDESRHANERICKEASEMTVRFQDSYQKLKEAVATKKQLNLEVAHLQSAVQYYQDTVKNHEEDHRVAEEALAATMQLHAEVERLQAEVQHNEDIVAHGREENHRVVVMCQQASQNGEYWRHEAGRWKADAGYHLAESRKWSDHAFRADQRVLGELVQRLLSLCPYSGTQPRSPRPKSLTR